MQASLRNLFELCILILMHPSLGSRFLTVKRQWALGSPPVMVTIITINNYMYNILKPEQFLSS